ncbi:M90 family metallopeptidase [Pseudoalteromonas sp. BDTF-M6]|uniref:M90 family metallopeptidase n=1 Tax=Pseudoalteromonas sp. BDTF-M6 TaxID=2796132 RepID=UPI001BAF2AF6|nr:M90 family metallopeptidase [Pseudoalteromonas sp. BDTF-M6]MBS3796450.1 zinc-dependent peptidase [Pseudoalteromonas sp. BDTF-M6]
MINVALISLLVAFVIVYWQQDALRLGYWRRKYQSAALSAPQKQILLRAMPIYRAMTDADRAKLERHICWFLGEKRFLGRDGLRVNEAMKLVVAANASLLMLNKPWPLYPNVKEILLYPSAYYADVTERDMAGLVSYHQVVREGESWPGGTLVLSWHDVLEGNRLPGDGHNLVFHEFAHQLDQVTGQTNGTPLLADRQSYRRWGEVCSRAYNKLKSHIAYNMPHVMHGYGATNEAEFFAVATETFIEKPAAMRQFDAELFNVLKDYYQFDPSDWQR